MEILNPDRDPERFFALLARSSERVLFLDFDGTLAPFRDDRHAVRPYEGVPERLEAILDAGHTRVVIITGRSVAEMPALLGLSVVPEIWGTHGWERRHPDGRIEGPDLAPDAAQALTEAHGQAEALALGDRLERKPATVAVHTRGLSEAEAASLLADVHERWRPIAQRTAAELHRFDGGLELRVPGRDKGTAVTTVLTEMDAPMAAYLGDDHTDEDAFRALGARGLGVLVREAFRETEADVWIRPPEELVAWLDRWHRASKEEAPYGL